MTLDQRLTARNVRDLAACPFCGALAGSRCIKWQSSDFEEVTTNHRARVRAAISVMVVREAGHVR